MARREKPKARAFRRGLGTETVEAEVLAETAAAVVLAWEGAANLTVYGIDSPVIVQVRRGSLTRRRLARELRALADAVEGSIAPTGGV